MGAVNNSPWYLPIIQKCEQDLIDRGIPPCYWGYILSNRPPDDPHHDGLGAIYNRRSHFMKSAQNTMSTMGATVVDGRDIVLVRKWIGGRDWTQSEENNWLRDMEKASKREKPQNENYNLL